MKQVIFEFDDLHFTEPEDCLNEIDHLVKVIPNIKLSFFAVPMLRGNPIYENPLWIKRIHEHIKNNNVRLAVHGLEHLTLEFENINFENAMYRIQTAEDLFKQAELPFVKVFKGPHWGINLETLDALSYLEYTHVYNHDDHIHLELNKYSFKFIHYNWNLKDEFEDNEQSLVVAHGHTWDTCSNGIKEVTPKIIEFVNKYHPTFKFVDEV